MDTPMLKWCQCSGAGAFQKDPDINLTTNPCTWESLADLCSNFWRCLNSAGPCGQCLIVHLSLPGTHVRIDIGNVKAAGVLCILGISFGIGTYVLYKIYNRFIRPSVRRKPSNDSTVHEEDRADVGGNVCWLPQSDEENMGNQCFSPTDVTVYYKPGFDVSLKRIIDSKHHLRNRKSNSEFLQCDCGDLILEGSLQSRNSIISLENSHEIFGIKSVNNNENSGQGRVRHAPSLSQLHIAVDESGFVEDDGNGDKSSLKGNFSPASLCEKNLQLFTESGEDLETDGRESQNYPKLDVWKVNRYFKSSSVLVSPTKDEISSSISEAFVSGSQGYSVQSSESDASEIHCDMAESSAAEPFETDDDREQLSPLPYDVSPPRKPNKLFTQKLKLKLGEISSQFVKREVGINHSSPSSATDSYSVEQKRIDGTNIDRENSISGISSPELELLHNENTEESLVVNTNTFNKIEDEIHVVEDEFENISKEIHALSSKYSSVDFELKKISQTYHSMSVHQTENSESTDSPNVSETEDDVDLSWEHENLMSQLYSETAESHSSKNRSLMNLIKEPSNNASLNDSISQDLSLPSHSVGCSVEIDGSLYEDEFHLQLGTQAIPKLKEPPINNVSEKFVISEYADTEWKGNTDKAKLMRQAYKLLPDHCHCCHLRRIRGDNYCGIRSTLYQALVNGLPTFSLWASKEKALEELSLAYNNQSSGICQWIFANRLSFTSENLFEIMQRCVSTLYAKLSEITQYSSYSDREGYIEKLLNSDPKYDLELMEGVKLLMSLSAFHLHSAMELGKDVPVFSWLMFARDTSETVASFVKNHLNTIGDSGGLEQVEMCLLGYTLGVRIRVYRLQQYSQEDFISHYPEDGTDTWPVVSLIAEDDRHYNIPVV